MPEQHASSDLAPTLGKESVNPIQDLNHSVATEPRFVHQGARGGQLPRQNKCALIVPSYRITNCELYICSLPGL